MKKILTISLLILGVIFTLGVAACSPGNGDSGGPFTGGAVPETEDRSSPLSGNDRDRSRDPDRDRDCDIMENVRLTAAPVNVDDLVYIIPMGLMTSSHVTPVDHQYYYWDDFQAPLDKYPVFSPADGYVTEISYLDNDYIVRIEHSCDVYSIYIHLEHLAGPIAEYNGQVTWNRSARVNVPVKAGEIIALDGGTFGFDFSLHDSRVVLSGFVNPESYLAEPWKIHTVDPYDYFEETVKTRLLTKNVRQIEPLGGKIDHDVPGRLSGNWFVENTNGYMGIDQTDTPIKPDQQIGYWNTHLAIAPDPIDPTVTIMSFGWFDGQTAQLAVREPEPSPADVSVETGPVKYQLWDWQYVHRENGLPWGGLERKMAADIEVRIGEYLRGTVLFQMLGETSLKMEVFPGLKNDEVTGFTTNAEIYER